MTDSLRSRAEALLDTNPVATPAVPTIDVQKLVHELRIHQVELEMQNAELQRSQIELAESRDAYVELYDFAPVGYLTLDPDGVILEANLTAATLLGVGRGKLVHRKFAAYVDRDAQDDWYQYCRAIQLHDDRQKIALVLRRADKTSFTARLVAGPLAGASPRTRRSMMAVIDISARIRAENALREANRTLEHLVEQRTEQLRRLAAQLSLAEEQQRRRIAAELHDELGQMLAACRIRLDLLRESLMPETAIPHLESLTRTLDGAIDSTRNLTFELSSPILDQLGLGPALEQLCLDMSGAVTIGFSSGDDCQSLPLSDERRLVLYRCTRELLVNVVRHAQARKVGVTLERTGPCLLIRVEDDGQGFDAAEAGKGFSATGGFGLFNIREHVEHTGGDVRIESGQAGGTRVTLEVPLEEDS